VNKLDNTLRAVRDHSRQFTGFTYVYPVISRRSGGLSLGINLNPDKVCNFDCIYCEVNRRVPGGPKLVDVARLRQELTALVQLVKQGELQQQDKFRDSAPWTNEIKDIAFSGDGEPTMAPNFSACVRVAVEVKQAEQLDRTKLVLITNAAGLDKTDVQEGLLLLDAHQGEIWGKLDAGTEAYYREVNRSFIHFDRLLKNLLLTARIRPIVIQSLFLKVHGAIMPAAELSAYCQRLNDLVSQGAQLKEVHAYTVARPTPEAYATKLEPDELESIAETIRRLTRLKVETFA
jgi:wyosine [tRNA(Phe)-imidazoG37] synthetase (radical SAM superfamily)